MTFSDAVVLSQFQEASLLVRDAKPLVCLVCGRATNTGQHYGVTACLGCKTFFRRVVLQDRFPRCKFQKKCTLEKGGVTKRICRHCRFQKCKEIGMKEEALHPCRDLIGRRRSSIDDGPAEPAELPSPSTSSDEGEIKPTPLSPNSLEAMSFLTSLRDFDVITRRKIARPFGCEPHLDSNFYSPEMERLHLNIDLAASLRPALCSLREWASNVPGFQNLSNRLQRYLLTRFSMMYTIIEHGLCTAQLEGTHSTKLWCFPDNTCLTVDLEDLPERLVPQINASIQHEHKLLCEFVNQMVTDVAIPLRTLRLSTEEVVALKVLMFMKPTILREAGNDLCTTSEREFLCNTRDRVLRGLHALHAFSPHPERRLSQVLMLSGSIEISAAQAVMHLRMMRFFEMAHFDDDTSELVFGAVT